MRGATVVKVPMDQKTEISIHAPRAGCDQEPNKGIVVSKDFNPRTPCGVRLQFNYTIPASCDFNPRTPCGVRRLFLGLVPGVFDFNPRTPCGVRPRIIGSLLQDFKFQSTHPVRGATVNPLHPIDVIVQISIHAPRAGCDGLRSGHQYTYWHFNPRTPCGVRPLKHLSSSGKSQFQSTHPVRGATRDNTTPTTPPTISIHAPRAGCDQRSVQHP